MMITLSLSSMFHDFRYTHDELCGLRIKVDVSLENDVTDAVSVSSETCSIDEETKQEIISKLSKTTVGDFFIFTTYQPHFNLLFELLTSN